MLKCDVFELEINVKHGPRPLIDYTFYTDLPAGTRVVLSCQRTFVNMRDEECLWVGHNEAIIVEPSIHGDYNGSTGRIDGVASDEKALRLFNQINEGCSPGVKTPVSDEFTIVLTVGGRQRLRAFGKDNRELAGQMVDESGGINIVEVSESVKLPMLEELQPLTS